LPARRRHAFEQHRQLRRPLAGHLQQVGQAPGEQAQGDFQHLGLAHLVPDAVGEQLRGEHATDQDQHQAAMQRTWPAAFICWPRH
jgi:hypothetical protein